jgi:hypothetical protein
MRVAIVAAVLAGALAQSARPDARLPAESAGWDNVIVGLLSAFDRADVLALGDAHARQVDSDLRLRLVRHPDFARRVSTIVVEFAAVDSQVPLTRYVIGDNVSLEQLKLQYPARGIPLIKDFLDAIRAINAKSPLKHIQVIAGHPPAGMEDSGAIAADVIRDAVSHGEKVLVIYGSGHLWHGNGRITTALDQTMPGRVFVAETFAPVGSPRAGQESQQLDASLKALDDTLSSPDRPTLVSLRGTRAATLTANPFFLGQAMLAPATTLGDLDDAGIYFGRTPELGR